jgi:hypothetical protein
MTYFHPSRKSLYLCLVAVCAVSFCSCYSFTGASVPPHWKSIALPLFDDESNFGQPALREKITNTLIEKFQRDNSLAIADRATATVELKGTITAIEADQPIAVAQGTQASKLQITLHASVTLYDNSLKKQAWTKSFTATGNYAPSGGFSERDLGLKQAVDKLADDVLLETLSAW